MLALLKNVSSDSLAVLKRLEWNDIFSAYINLESFIDIIISLSEFSRITKTFLID